jgi:hypothetical protein
MAKIRRPVTLCSRRRASSGSHSSRFHVSALLVAVTLIQQPSAAAETPRPFGVATSLGYGYPAQHGFGVTGGLWARWQELMAFASIDLTFVPGPPNERYQMETFDNGQTVCRDHSNGQFAKDSECGSVEILTAGMVEVLLLPLPNLFLGLGIRTSPAPGPYGAFGYAGDSGNPSFLFVRGAVGDDFAQVHVGYAL